jgi:predicted RNA-binding Zn ribbon-like protein
MSNPFDWSGGHPALDFVNTLDERPLDRPVERLSSYGDLVRFVELAGLITDPAAVAALQELKGPACAHVTNRARVLREHAFSVLEAHHHHQPPLKVDLEAISAAVRRAHSARALAWSTSANMAGHRWSRAEAAATPLLACVLAIEDLLTRVDRKRVRRCGANDCAVYFLDTSKSQRRQWCSMKNCGNREKQRRWRSAK